jgi:hypothetical protein
MADLLAEQRRIDPFNLPGEEARPSSADPPFLTSLLTPTKSNPPPLSSLFFLSSPFSLCNIAGELRQGGRRHDNDFVDYRQIRIVPTAQELLCPHAPYLPGNNK